MNNATITNRLRHPLKLSIMLTLFFTLSACQQNADNSTTTTPNKATSKPQKKAATAKWQSLFDGKTLGDWKSTEFGGEGEADVEDGLIYITNGVGLSGITWQKNFPKNNYELSVDFKKTDGSDFALALTFPVKESHCSFICGGWGGANIGLSSIDHFDASNNETTDLHKFDTDKWYTVRVRVTTDKIEAWIDNEKVTDYVIKGHLITTRPEVNLAKPLGLSNYQTGSAYKNIKYKLVSGPDSPPINEYE